MARSMTFAAAARAALQQALDDDAVLVGDTVGCPGSATEGLAGQLMAVPSGDRGAVGLALGMALAGRRVIVELPTAARLAAVTEVLAEAGRLAASEHPVTLVIRVPYGRELGALDAPLGRALAPIPGVRVVCSSSARQEAGLLLGAVAHRGVTVLLSPRSLAGHRSEVDLVPSDAHLRRVRDGHHVTIAAWGAGVSAACQAADALATEGIEAMVVDLVTLAPLPHEALGELVQTTGRLVVAHPEDDTLAEHVRAVGLHRAFLHLESPLTQVLAHTDPIVRAARDAVFY